MRESIIERYLITETKKMGGIAIKMLSPGMAGLPDRLVLLPEGKLFFVELKAKGKKPRPLQKAVHKLLRDLGFAVYTLDSKEGVQEVLKKYGVQTTQVSGNSH